MTTTATPTAPAPDVDTTDLDLLDDDHPHARCTVCYPDLPFGASFIAICGEPAIVRDPDYPYEMIPAHACPRCVALFNRFACPRCGT